MAENKLTLQELTKALECCAGSSPDCTNCPANKYEAGKCFDTVKVQAVSVMNSQQAEIERLSNSAKQWEDTAKDLLISKEKQQAEIERLKIQNEHLLTFWRETQEELDNLVKEMVGEQG